MKTMVMIPTYNEKDNIVRLIGDILADYPDFHIVVVDDDSPDGTYKAVEDISKKDPRVHLIHRKDARGRGTAGVAGFKYALAAGADYIIEMDADFSHHPGHIRQFMDNIKEYDIVVGSRFVKGGRQRRSLFRHLLTIVASLFIRFLLKISIKDCTSGFKCFRRTVLEKIDLDSLRCQGPSVLEEILYKAFLLNFRIIEVPIVFQDRKFGKSTFNTKIMFETYSDILKIKKDNRTST